MAQDFSVTPLTSANWTDFETLMGPKGGCGGCWCMLWRLKKRDYDRMSDDDNRRAIKEIAAGSIPPGLLAYDGDQSIGWISIGPRQDFVRLETSRVLAPVDEEPVWSVSCFFIDKRYRNRGVGQFLLEAACDFVRSQGATILEGYPIAPTKSPYPSTYAWTGFHKIFARAGFEEVLRRSETRPIMRKSLI